MWMSIPQAAFMVESIAVNALQSKMMPESGTEQQQTLSNRPQRLLTESGFNSEDSDEDLLTLRRHTETTKSAAEAPRYEPMSARGERRPLHNGRISLAVRSAVSQRPRAATAISFGEDQQSHHSRNALAGVRPSTGCARRVTNQDSPKYQRFSITPNDCHFSDQRTSFFGRRSSRITPKHSSKGSENRTVNEDLTLFSIASSNIDERGKGSYLVHRLCASGVHVNDRDRRGRTPLMVASIHGRHEIVHALLRWGAKVNLADNSGNSALHFACRNGNLETVKCLLDSGASDRQQNFNAESPLLLAARHGHVEVIKNVLGVGRPKNGKRSLRKTSAVLNSASAKLHGSDSLLEAAYRGHVQVVETLAEAGLITDLESRDGENPLLASAVAGRHEIIRVVLDALFRAYYRKCNNPVRIFVSKLGLISAYSSHEKERMAWGKLARDVEESDLKGRTGLHLAAMRDHAQVIRELLKCNPNIDKTDAVGYTPLMYAAAHGSSKSLLELLRAGANIDLKTPTGATLMDLAEKQSKSKSAVCIKLLRSAAEPWSPVNSLLFPSQVRQTARLLCSLASTETENSKPLQSQRTSAHPGLRSLPREIMYNILSFIPRQ